MTDLLVRQVSEEVVQRLKTRARMKGRSLQQELKLLLEASVAVDSMDALALARKVRRRLAREGRKQTDSGELVREDRDR